MPSASINSILSKVTLRSGSRIQANLTCMGFNPPLGLWIESLRCIVNGMMASARCKRGDTAQLGPRYMHWTDLRRFEGSYRTVAESPVSALQRDSARAPEPRCSLSFASVIPIVLS
jgi:hypothetical protein